MAARCAMAVFDSVRPSSNSQPQIGEGNHVETLEYENARGQRGRGGEFVGSDLTAYRTWLAAPATLGLSLRTLSTHVEVNLTICPTVWPFAFGLDGADWYVRMEHDEDGCFAVLVNICR